MIKYFTLIFLLTLLISCGESNTNLNSPKDNVATKPVLRDSVPNTQTVLLNERIEAITAILGRQQMHLEQVAPSSMLDMDYAKLMSVLTQQSIELGEYYLRTAEDKSLQNIASELLAFEKKELAQWLNIVKELRLKSGGLGDKDEEEYKSLSDSLFYMTRSLNDSLAKIELNNNLDLDFAVILHSQLEGEMAISKWILKNTSTKKIKSSALDDLNTNREQIKKLSSWIKKNSSLTPEI